VGINVDKTPTRTSNVTPKLYGIKNCDTVKKARAWLDSHRQDYQFHDFKTLGIERKQLEQWCRRIGWEVLLNRSGTTYRKLPEAVKTSLSAEKAIDLMLAQPSMIKRPVLEYDGQLSVGFKPDAYQRALSVS
jgi:arsenate reductase